MYYAKWVIAMALASLAIWTVWHHLDYVENGDFLTLEARYTPDEILDAQRTRLLGGSARSFKNVSIKYHPYLMLEVKYLSPDKQSREGNVLWSLYDGEILLNSETGDRTHGYHDAIVNQATRNDYKLLHALAKQGGALPLDQLQRELRLDEDGIDNWVNSARTKHLVTQKGNAIQLHFQNPKLVLTPQSIIAQRVVTKPYAQADWLPKRFSSSQIQAGAKAAFGSDFSVRSTQEIYLPLFSVEVLNPDGSVMTSYWNPLNGRQVKN